MRIFFSSKTYLVFAFLSFVNGNVLYAQQTIGYQTPPAPMVDIINSATTQVVKISPNGNFMVVLETLTYLPIAEFAKPELKLANLCLNPQNNALSNAQTFTSIKLKNTTNNKDFEPFEGLPISVQIADVQFSPDNKYIAFTNTTDFGVQLWLAKLSNQKCKILSNLFLNNTYGNVYQWLPDGQTILAKFLPDNRKAPPQNNPEFSGPIVQQNLGALNSSKTCQDVLKNGFIDQLFDYYLSSQLKFITLNGQTTNYSNPGVFKDFNLSPDGRYVITKTIAKPYAYNEPINNYSYTVNLVDKFGLNIKTLATVPLADNLPNGYDAVVTGQREHGWRSDKPCTYFWVQALDGGNPNIEAKVRDVVFIKDINQENAQKLTSCYYRFNKINWGDDNIAIVTERWHKTRSERRVYIKPSAPLYRVNLWDRYYENSYNDPGDFVQITNTCNKNVLLIEYKNTTENDNLSIFSISEGYSPQGNCPYLLKFNAKTKLSDTLFCSKAPFYEKPIFFNNQDFIITNRQSVTETPNYFLTELSKKNTEQLTFFIPQNTQLLGLQKFQLNYKRKDSLSLSATLFLPKNYDKKNGALPVLIWAYPKTYKTAIAAGQIKTSPYIYTNILWPSPVFWATQGYAILDNVEMPIVGESNDEPNDTFINQLTQNAQATVAKIVKMGIANVNTVAIGGHLQGAFTTANLLAHTNIFAAGIAQNGTYDCTLNPFSFEDEERTYWQVPKLYNVISPFAYADKIKTPLLLLQNQTDNNQEVFALQNQIFYNALKINGANTRLVTLPLEAKCYNAKESVLHTLWEVDNWLNLYLKLKH